jgi:hypothetical protein
MLRRKFTALFFFAAALLAGCSKHAESVFDSSNKAVVPNNSAIRVSALGSDSAEPGIASSPDGTVFVVWVDHIDKAQANVMVQRFDANGRSVGPAVRVNPQAGQAKAWRGDPPTVIAASNGDVYVGWTAKIEGAKGGNTLYLSVSRDTGQSFDPPVKINDDSEPASHGMHSMTIDSSGHIHFAWLDERYLNSQKKHIASDDVFLPQHTAFLYYKTAAKEESEPNAEVFTAVSIDGGRSFSANKRIAADACPCCKTSILAGANNEIYLAWRQVQPGDFRHIAIARSTDSGQTFTPAVIVSDDRWQLSACPVSGAAMSFDNGGLRAAWFTAGEAGTRGLYISESRDGGKTFSPRKLVAESSVSGTPMFIGETLLWNDLDTVNTISIGHDLSTTDQHSVGTGSVAVAARASDKLAAAFTTNKESRSAVWLLIR